MTRCYFKIWHLKGKSQLQRGFKTVVSGGKIKLEASKVFSHAILKISSIPSQFLPIGRTEDNKHNPFHTGVIYVSGWDYWT